MDDFQEKYLTEAGLRIQYEGFTVCEEKDGLLPIEWAGSRVCNVNGNGGIAYDPEQIRRKGLVDVLDRVREVVDDTLAYMRCMEIAPPLLADGLSGDLLKPLGMEDCQWIDSKIFPPCQGLPRSGCGWRNG